MKERIKQIRNELNLTQQEFADKIGVRRSTVANYEIGRNEPIDSVINLICREYNINESWLRTGEGEMFVPAPASEMEILAQKYGLSDVDQIIVKRFVSLPEKEREVLRAYILQVAEDVRAAREAAAAAPAEPSIDELVEDYRRRLEAERKGAPSASSTTPGSRTAG